MKQQKGKKSAGLLVFRRSGASPEVFLVHMGGPFWQHKDEGAWTIPKGEFEDNEAPLAAAQREFQEETSLTPEGQFLELAPVKQASGKVVFAWAVEGDCDATKIKSNTFSIEWPKGSGAIREFPEVDRAGWFSLVEARKKLVKGQVPLVDELEKVLGSQLRGPNHESR
jgi:predicted NUDIX family NTP pyrophosphohydrolase